MDAASHTLARKEYKKHVQKIKHPPPPPKKKKKKKKKKTKKKTVVIHEGMKPLCNAR